ncbi:MAG: hypothetical protein IKH63_03070 [Prevotella sp.]|nr:hypothetical protein [Prevotella sp.]
MRNPNFFAKILFFAKNVWGMEWRIGGNGVADMVVVWLISFCLVSVSLDYHSDG